MLIAVFIWLYVLSIKYKRVKEPGYVPKVLKWGMMQNFQFVKKLREPEHQIKEREEAENSAVLEDESPIDQGREDGEDVEVDTNP